MVRIVSSKTEFEEAMRSVRENISTKYNRLYSE